MTPITGGCLCGQVRYEAQGEPIFAGHCFCRDCQRVSGCGSIPFMGFPADRLSITGETQRRVTGSMRGTQAVRNHCPHCGALVFGGIVGEDDQHTVYAGTLDDPSRFVPTIAIFVRDRPDWAVATDGLNLFQTAPGPAPGGADG